jgi:hypothetical protein
MAGKAASMAVRIKLKINGGIARFFIVFILACHCPYYRVGTGLKYPPALLLGYLTLLVGHIHEGETKAEQEVKNSPNS